jgi:sugar lactone lactonase YvrE
MKPRIEPVKRTDIPPAPARARQRRSSTPFPRARPLPLEGATHPEDVVVDAEGRLVCGVEGGRILRVHPGTGAVETIGDTGGRPLGLELQQDGRLIVCDPHRGLLRLDPKTGEIETLVRLVDDMRLRFCSNATAAADGTIWFTESTSRFDFEHYLGAIIEHRPSGRLMRRDPDGTVEVVVDELYFANGVTLTADETAVIFAETGASRISRLDVQTGQVQVIADNLPGYPDNISRLRDGRFWAALPNPRDPTLERLATSPPLLRKLLWRIPDRLMPEGKKTTWVMAFDEEGRALADLQDDRPDFHMVTGVAEHDGRLYLAPLRHSALLDLDVREIR